MGSAIAFVFPVVVIAAVYLACFVQASGHGRGAAVAVGALGAGAALVLALLATLFYSLRCDENCNENLVPSARTAGWQNTSHAWEWDAQWGLAIGVLAAAVVAMFLAGLRLKRPAVVTAAIATACAITWAIVLAS